MPPPPAALPLRSSNHEQSHLESCTSFRNVHWHVCPQLCGITICHIDLLQSHSRFVSPLPDPPRKANARIAFRIWIFSSFFQEVQSIQVLLLGCHCLIFLCSQILRDLHEQNHHPPPPKQKTPGVPSVQFLELFLRLPESRK